MKIEEIRREYVAKFEKEMIVDKQKFLESSGFTYEEELEVIRSDEFKAFIEEFENEIRTVMPQNFFISTEDFREFKESPHFGGNANVVNEICLGVIREDDNNLEISIEIYATIEIESR